jgi:hypothetical protein
MLEEIRERTIKELLQLMLDNQNLFERGLCHWNDILYRKCLITKKERTKLYVYIQDNRPSMVSSIEAFISRDSEYYWKFGNIKPRIEWIKKHIKKNK